jgi:Holliday junction resolvase RusA-like endonuclease
LGEKEMPRFNSPVCIVVHSYRKRLCDPDGISAKAVIDGIVKAGILSDDTTKQIEEVRFKQTKIKSKEEEKTEITIYESHKKEGV